MRWFLVLAVFSCGCFRRQPAASDGTCAGDVQADYSDCVADVEGRFAAARAMTAVGSGLNGDQSAIVRLEHNYDRAIHACRWTYEMHMDACRARER